MSTQSCHHSKSIVHDASTLPNQQLPKQNSDILVRKRVLLSAFACAPNRGSEPGIGWNWAKQAARHHDVYLLTSTRNAPEIEAEARRKELDFKVTYVRVPGWPEWLLPPTRALRVYYLLWQLAILPVTYSLNRTHQFDLIHHVTYNSIEIPGFLWLLRPEFVWGPVGGAQVPPKALWRYFGWRWSGEILRRFRKQSVRANPFVRLAIRKAKVVLAANADTEHLLRLCGGRRIVREIELGIDMQPPCITPPAGTDGTFNILWVGRLIPRKGPLLALEVVNELKRRNISARMLMAGDGPQRKAIEQRVVKLGLRHHVTLLGAIPYSSMSSCYSQAHAFLFSSLHDTSGNVVVEAMANGLPVVTLDHHGAAEMVDGKSGIKVAISSESQVINELASALELLATDHRLRYQMGQYAQTHVAQHFVWTRKAALLKGLYADSITR